VRILPDELPIRSAVAGNRIALSLPWFEFFDHPGSALKIFLQKGFTGRVFSLGSPNDSPNLLSRVDFNGCRGELYA
jgi:hypothetical protein